MALTEPVLDDRTYRQILEEALARIPVHLPEWTNFNDADPGVTVLQLFAFMTESLHYRANRIPERNRIKFLNLLGIPLQPAEAARGLVAFSNLRGAVETRVLPPDLELTAGQVPFRTVDGLAVLPVESRVFYKSALPADREAEVRSLYDQLFAALTGEGSELAFYETRELEPPRSGAAPPELDLGSTVDGSLWVALLARSPADVETARHAIAGQVMTLGVVPASPGGARELPPGGRVEPGAQPSLTWSLPRPTGRDDLGPSGERAARFDPLDARPSGDLLDEPGVVELPLPGAERLRLWDDLEPQDEGTGDFPPALAEDSLADRLVTWIRAGLRAASGTVTAETGRPSGRVSWLGINAARVLQRAHVAGEVLGRSTGEPDQELRLANPPVIPGSVSLTVGGEPWHEVEDLRLAAPEVPLGDTVWGTAAAASGPAAARAFTVDRASGALRFGDGLRGARPAAGAVVQASYDFGGGRAGMVGIGAISKGTSLPAGVQVANPVPTWGGADAETVPEAERRIPQTLRHRDRLVSERDFEEIARRAPGVDVGRVEVLPLFHPNFSGAPAEGVVTLLVIPRFDPLHPEAPEPDARFLETLCAYLAPRRLVTTELWVSGPSYVPVWLSVGIEVVAGRDQAGAREAVKRELRRFLSPLEGGRGGDGWPLSNPVEALEIWAVAARVEGVAKVTGVLLGRGGPVAADRIDLAGLELPRLAALSVQAGDPAPLSELAGPPPAAGGPRRVPVPVVPQEC